jgi:hypothetical protein
VVRIGVVDALHRDLMDVRAEELQGQVLGAVGRGRRTFTITSRPVLRRHGPGGPPSKPPISGRSGLKTRRLHALSRKKAVDGGAVDAQDPPDANGIEPSVVNQPPDGLGMDAELARDLTNAHQVTRVSAY